MSQLNPKMYPKGAPSLVSKYGGGSSDALLLVTSTL